MLALLLLALQDDAYVAGYAAAILEREFALKDVEVRVERGVITLRGEALGEADPDKVRAALTRIPGARDVVLHKEPGERRARGWEGFPDWRLFDPLLADPRWPHFSAAYKLFAGDERLEEAAAVSFGEFFSFVGYDAGDVGRFELGAQAGVFATFDLDSESFDLINADYLIAFPLSWRLGPYSAQARVYHQSSHLGDEFLLREAIDRVNLSYEAVDLRLSAAPLDGLRLYAGGGYIVHSDPEDLDSGLLQAGIEFDTRAEWFGGFLSPVGAVDLQRWEESDSDIDVSARIGVEIQRPDRAKRRILLLFEFYRGRNSDGQFYDETIKTYGLGLHLHF